MQDGLARLDKYWREARTRETDLSINWNKAGEQNVCCLDLPKPNQTLCYRKTHLPVSWPSLTDLFSEKKISPAPPNSPPVTDLDRVGHKLKV